MKNNLLFIVITILCFQAGFSQTLPNMDMESWMSVSSYEEPGGGVWATANAIHDLNPAAYPVTTTKSTDAHGGSFSAKIETKKDSWFGVLITGTLATGVFNASASPGNNLKRGTPYTSRPERFRGWYKFTSVSGDSAVAYAWLTKYNTGTSSRDTVGIAYMQVNNTVSSWTQFDLIFDYKIPDAPDSISIVFASSAAGENFAGQVGNTMWIDDLELVMTTGVSEVLMPESNVTVYPNPASEKVTFELSKGVKEGLIKVYNVNGQLVREDCFNGKIHSLTTSDWVPGNYSYVIIEKDTKVVSGNFIVK